MKQDEFFDEQIIDMINQSEQKTAASISNQSESAEKAEENVTADPEKQSIDTGIKILGRWIYFERQPLAKEM